MKPNIISPTPSLHANGFKFSQILNSGCTTKKGRGELLASSCVGSLLPISTIGQTKCVSTSCVLRQRLHELISRHRWSVLNWWGGFLSTGLAFHSSLANVQNHWAHGNDGCLYVAGRKVISEGLCSFSLLQTKKFVFYVHHLKILNCVPDNNLIPAHTHLVKYSRDPFYEGFKKDHSSVGLPKHRRTSRIFSVRRGTVHSPNPLMTFNLNKF